MNNKAKDDTELLEELVRLQRAEKKATQKQKDATILISAALLLIALFQLITTLLPLPDSILIKVSILVFILLLTAVTVVAVLKDT